MQLPTHLFLIPLGVALLSEVVKVVVHGIRTGNFEDKLFQAGGMPSTHSAMVTSLLVIVGQKLGTESVEFAIAFVFSAIIWFDACNSRREIGVQAQILNTLQHVKHLTERIGHSVKEVIGGILFGGIVTWALLLLL